MMIREMIKNELDRQGLSNYRISEMSGVRADLIGRFLRGESNLRSDNIDKLSKALKVTSVSVGVIEALLKLAETEAEQARCLGDRTVFIRRLGEIDSLNKVMEVLKTYSI